MCRLVACGLIAFVCLALFAETGAARQPAPANAEQLEAAKALRGVGNFDKAEKLLTDAIGTNDKRGPAFGSIEFRKELARLYETKAATLTGKEANTEWGKALKEWTTLFQAAQNGLKRTTPQTPPDEVKVLKNSFYDAYFEIQRVIAVANQQLVKDPVRLTDRLETTGKKIFDLENLHKFNEVKQVPNAGGKMVPVKAGTEVITPEVWARYCDLLDKNPKLKAAYQKAGGRFFLERPPTNDSPAETEAGAGDSGACNTRVVAHAPQCSAHVRPRKVGRGGWPLCRKMATYR